MSPRNTTRSRVAGNLVAKATPARIAHESLDTFARRRKASIARNYVPANEAAREYPAVSEFVRTPGKKIHRPNYLTLRWEGNEVGGRKMRKPIPATRPVGGVIREAARAQKNVGPLTRQQRIGMAEWPGARQTIRQNSSKAPRARLDDCLGQPWGCVVRDVNCRTACGVPGTARESVVVANRVASRFRIIS